MIRSLRYRLLVGASLCSAVVLALLGISVYGAMRHALLAEFDSSLETDARLLTTMIEMDDGRPRFDFQSDVMPDYDSKFDRRYFQIWRADGQLMQRSRSLDDRNLPRIPITSREAAAGVELPNSQIGRAISISHVARARGRDERRPVETRTVNIVVAAAPIEVSNTLRLLGWMLTILCTTAVLLMGAVLLHVVGRGLRPVNHLANQIGAMQETDLTRRLPQEGVPTELTPMVDKLNGLLGRLESAFTREKSFTADVAHELRTPLTGLRMTLEVCRSQPRQTLAYETAIDECRGIIDRMEAMVESLLMLARSDAGQMTVDRKSVDVSDLVSECWSLVQHRAEQNGVTVATDLPESCMVETDPDKLRIVLQNVLDNAVSYVDKSGRIRIAIRRDGHGASIEIANTGSQISAEDAAKLFERFWRGDTARTDAGTHCGLGLSLSQRLMKLIGGEIFIKTDRDGEFVVCLMIPGSSAAVVLEGKRRDGDSNPGYGFDPV